MKATIMLGALLLLSVFAGAFATASEQAVGPVKLMPKVLRADSAVSADGQIAVDPTVQTSTSGDVQADNDLAVSANDVETAVDTSQLAGFPAVAIAGHGWYTDSDNNAGFAQIAIVSKVFVNKNDASGQKTEVVRGVIHLGKEGTFPFEATRTFSGTETDATKMEFTLYKGRAKDGAKIGTLSLEQTGKFVGNFRTWAGVLSVDGGKTYKLTLATDQRPVRKAVQANKGDDNDAKSFATKGEVKGVSASGQGAGTEQTGLKAWFEKWFSRSGKTSQDGSK